MIDKAAGTPSRMRGERGLSPVFGDERATKRVALSQIDDAKVVAWRRVFNSIILAFLILHLSGAAAAVPRTRPEAVGFSSERLNRIDTLFSEKVEKGELAGIVMLVARHGKVAHLSAIGYADLGTHRKMQADAIFRLYSMTKPIAATALMTLYEEGKFQLDDPISKYLPEFKGIRVLRTPDAPITDTVSAVREPTIHDLFRHTAGLSHGAEPEKNAVDAAYIQANLFGLDLSLSNMMTKLARIPLHYQPGTKWSYSIGQDVQARLVEVLSDMPFGQFLQQRLFGPLGMKDTGYSTKDPSRLVPIHWAKEGKLVPCDESHGCPEGVELSVVNSYAVDHAHKGGSSGLLGTAEDYWRFGQMLLNGGEFDGRRILSPTTVRYMARDHLGPSLSPNVAKPLSAVGWGLGFAVVKDPAALGMESSEGSFYWGGAANTLFWIDPKEDIVVVAMTQHLAAPTVNADEMRSELSAIVYGALLH